MNVVSYVVPGFKTVRRYLVGRLLDDGLCEFVSRDGTVSVGSLVAARRHGHTYVRGHEARKAAKRLKSRPASTTGRIHLYVEDDGTKRWVIGRVRLSMPGNPRVWQYPLASTTGFGTGSFRQMVEQGYGYTNRHVAANRASACFRPLDELTVAS